MEERQFRWMSCPSWLFACWIRPWNGDVLFSFLPQLCGEVISRANRNGQLKFVGSNSMELCMGYKHGSKDQNNENKKNGGATALLEHKTTAQQNNERRKHEHNQRMHGLRIGYSSQSENTPPGVNKPTPISIHILPSWKGFSSLKNQMDQ
jgi:hypothetical protein